MRLQHAIPILSLLAAVTASKLPKPDHGKALSSCPPGGKNRPKHRACWKGRYDIDTDHDTDWPETGVTRRYDLAIANGTAARDGIRRQTFLINGEYMGPTLYADWGDHVEITVTNNLQDNGTGIHWHGI
ncbi:laccase, multicopper oxidase, benzenediol:oxygen oxidorectuctase [Vermiconidia calcicola]|uniref:Laccase, multicopper oxidase, benzenediol:oxygen oxidorectuctase n=1 Tax=Vermiconidia calcicola TaxID=1690605 RepID=A0ACC3N810_9PEZI|nr:laccase, multicopper oxidase, benzenediol:oxygen oxidorectuctase [Vermiconidia calcicola]